MHFKDSQAHTIVLNDKPKSFLINFGSKITDLIFCTGEVPFCEEQQLLPRNLNTFLLWDKREEVDVPIQSELLNKQFRFKDLTEKACIFKEIKCKRTTNVSFQIVSQDKHSTEGS